LKKRFPKKVSGVSYGNFLETIQKDKVSCFLSLVRGNGKPNPKMKSVLNIEVSCFKNYNTAEHPKTVNLLNWLTSDKYKDQVNSIRSLPTKEERDTIKATIPAITPSGVFHRRKAKALIKHSGLIQFDIDFAGNNRNILNYTQLKEQLCNIIHVAYCGLSVSGTGFWGLIPLAYPEHHKRQFEALKQAFRLTGIELDNKPGNVASLRGYSYDCEAYFNHNAKHFTGLPPQPIYNKPKGSKANIELTTYQKIERAVKKLEKAGCHFDEGNRHAYINNLCIMLVKYGVYQYEAEEYIYSNLWPEHLIKSNCITSPYRDFKNEFGIWVSV
jgi:hypothetical protein